MNASATYLLARLSLLLGRDLFSPDGVLAAGAAEPTSSDRDAIERSADEAEADGQLVALRHLQRELGLSEREVEVLLLAVAPDVSPDAGVMLGGLPSSRVSVADVARTLGCEVVDALSEQWFSEHGPLRTAGVLQIEPGPPFAVRTVWATERIVGFLAGADELPTLVVEALVPGSRELEPDETSDRIAASFDRCHVVDPGDGAVWLYATTALATVGWPALCVDLTGSQAPDELLAAAGLEATLRGAALVVGPTEQLVGDACRRILERLRCPLITVGRNWPSSPTGAVPIEVEALPLGGDARAELWDGALGPTSFDPVAAVSSFRMTPAQIATASDLAHRQADADGEPLSPTTLRAACRRAAGGSLDGLARRIRPELGWDDIVLHGGTETLLRDVAARVRHRTTVLGDWGLRRGGGRGRGVSALFVGESGTGKTMAAEVVAGDLGLDLYAVDLATVIDKYIGETEKKLERIFAAAEGVNAVLLFDEADALFGKRSEVKDARDRYANVEVAYLLQRMEAFDGLALLTSNLRANLDDAFTRRLDAIVDFRPPDEAQRLQLWQAALARVPTDGDLSLDALARTYELAGGAIRNVVTTAAYSAAEARGVVDADALRRAVDGELRKTGRLVTSPRRGALEAAS